MKRHGAVKSVTWRYRNLNVLLFIIVSITSTLVHDVDDLDVPEAQVFPVADDVDKARVLGNDGVLVIRGERLQIAIFLRILFMIIGAVQAKWLLWGNKEYSSLGSNA